MVQGILLVETVAESFQANNLFLPLANAANQGVETLPLIQQGRHLQRELLLPIFGVYKPVVEGPSAHENHLCLTETEDSLEFFIHRHVH